jgi:hypothetical protein
LIFRFVLAVFGSTVAERDPGWTLFVSWEQAFLWSPD